MLYELLRVINTMLKNACFNGKYMQPHFFIKTLQLPFDFLINFGFLSVKLKRHKSARYKQCNKIFINSNFLLSSMFNFFCGFLGCLISICNIFYILFYLYNQFIHVSKNGTPQFCNNVIISQTNL